ncbi:MAG: TolC family outer membrane protein [Burkholderiaceae bacterium]
MHPSVRHLALTLVVGGVAALPAPPSQAQALPSPPVRIPATPPATMPSPVAVPAPISPPVPVVNAAATQTLLDLYQSARAFDAAYLAARAQADSEVYKAEQVEALLRPSASLSGSAGRVETNPLIGPNFGSNALALGLTGRYPLYNRTSSATVAQARQALLASRSVLELAEQDLIVRVAQAYFDVLAAQDTLATTRASKAAISEQLASAKRNFEVGTATITDTREAQARFDLGTFQELAAENDLLNKRIALDQLVGRPNTAPAQLAIPVALPAPPTDVQAWAARAESQHPQIWRARIALDVARLEVEKARAGKLPVLDAVAGVNAGRGTTGTVTGSNASASLGVQLSLPLYTGQAVENRIAETQVLEDRARSDLDAALRNVSLATRTAFNALQSGVGQVRALEAAESSSQLALEATQLGYRVGVRVNLDVLNAQTQLFTTRRDLARARYDVLVNTLRLRQAAGELKPEDVARVNALLAR